MHKGKIQINKKHIKPKYKLKTNNKIHIPPIHITKQKKKTISPHLQKITTLTNIILYKNNHILILNKPSNTTIHNNNNLNFNIIKNLQTLHPKTQFLKLIHHLNQNTSNILLITKKHSTLHSLHKQLHKKKIQKNYLTLIHNQ